LNKPAYAPQLCVGVIKGGFTIGALINPGVHHLNWRTCVACCSKIEFAFCNGIKLIHNELEVVARLVGRIEGAWWGEEGAIKRKQHANFGNNFVRSPSMVYAAKLVNTPN
jgi:hypothetical protein